MLEELTVDRDFSFSDLIAEDDAKPTTSAGTKRERSQTDLLPCVTEDSEDGITDDERDELNEFLQGIGFTETPRSSLIAVTEAREVESSAATMPYAMPCGQWSTVFVPPPEKRRRVTATTPHSFANMSFTSMPSLPPAPPAVTYTAASQPSQRKRTISNKTRTSRQYVPFEEMTRLMAEYGPIKTQRKSKCCPDECGTAGNAKTDSIRRKFYRWFPDFEERFIRNCDGLTYRPKAGHDEEVEYRRTMREMDKQSLVHKRKIGRGS